MSAATYQTMAEQRKIVGYTQAELAELCSVGTPHISKIENGKEQPSPALADQIAHHLDVYTDEACEHWFDLCAACDGTGNVKSKTIGTGAGSGLRDAIAAAIDASCWAESSEYTPGGCGCDGFPCAHDVATLATERVLAVLDEHTTDEFGVILLRDPFDDVIRFDTIERAHAFGFGSECEYVKRRVVPTWTPVEEDT